MGLLTRVPCSRIAVPKIAPSYGLMLEKRVVRSSTARIVVLPQPGAPDSSAGALPLPGTTLSIEAAGTLPPPCAARRGSSQAGWYPLLPLARKGHRSVRPRSSYLGIDLGAAETSDPPRPKRTTSRGVPPKLNSMPDQDRSVTSPL